MPSECVFVSSTLSASEFRPDYRQSDLERDTRLEVATPTLAMPGGNFEYGKPENGLKAPTLRLDLR